MGRKYLTAKWLSVLWFCGIQYMNVESFLFSYSRIDQFSNLYASVISMCVFSNRDIIGCSYTAIFNFLIPQTPLLPSATVTANLTNWLLSTPFHMPLITEHWIWLYSNSFISFSENREFYLISQNLVWRQIVTLFLLSTTFIQKYNLSFYTNL